RTAVRRGVEDGGVPLCHASRVARAVEGTVPPGGLTPPGAGPGDGASSPGGGGAMDTVGEFPLEPHQGDIAGGGDQLVRDIQRRPRAVHTFAPLRSPGHRPLLTRARSSFGPELDPPWLARSAAARRLPTLFYATYQQVYTSTHGSPPRL